jgi:hypothetical protein
MNRPSPENLEQLIRASGQDWMIDFPGPKDDAIRRLRMAMEAATTEAQRRRLAVSLTEESLIGMYESHPYQVNAFLQAMGATRNPNMLIMVWRIMQGMTVAKVEMSYLAKERFRLRVVLSSPYGEPEEAYESQNINDASLLRHFGIMTMDDKPLFDGFYALDLAKRPAKTD